MKVWVLERGCYEERHIVGIYLSPTTAMANYPPRKGWSSGPGSAERSGGWQYDLEYNEWSNGLDWDEAMRLTEFEVIE